MTWHKLTFPELTEISEARKQYHQAIQNVAAVGRSLLPQVEDDHYANLEWDEKVQRLVGRWVEGETKFRSSISFEDFSVYLVDVDYRVISSFPLKGKKQNTVMVWLEEQFDDLGYESSKLSLERPYEIPEYLTAKGKPFDLSNMEIGELLGHYFHNTQMILKDLVLPMEGASEIKCWPHHFDIASLITLNDTGDPETSKSIGAGFSPGDDNYNEPYFYITPWPYPSEDALPDISNSGGFWHTDGWIGGILTASNLKHLDNSNDQHAAVLNFFKTGIEGLKEHV